MKRFNRYTLKGCIVLLLGLITIPLLLSFFKIQEIEIWGFFGHRKINHQAVFTLPPEMMFFFKNNIEYLTDHSIDPDKRRYASQFEAVRHYIDLDIYGSAPFENVPRSWTDALIQYSDVYFINEKMDTIELLYRDSMGDILQYEKELAFHPEVIGGNQRMVPLQDFRRFFINNFLPTFYEDHWTASCDSLQALLGISSDSFFCHKLIAEDHLSEHGILPWHLQHMLTRLSNAFLERDGDKIRRYAADIGHYIADAHVPLHTTENYNGQLTGQDGIHAFWESRLPELFADDTYDFWVGKAQFINQPRDYFWKIVLESHAWVDSVLSIELELRESFPPDLQMCMEIRGQTMVQTQCEAFAKAYHDRMGNMVEQRMKDAILSVGSVWYTAWVLAGQPDLKNLDQPAGNTDTLAAEIGLKRKLIKLRKHE